MLRGAILTISALICFALNSILCRIALKNGGIDAATFTLIRIAAGAVTLAAIARFAAKSEKLGGSWRSAAYLFGYAILFSYAYLSLTAGEGALILFGAVQLTMITAAMIQGERPRILDWAGLAAAFSGLIFLVLPGIDSPPPLSSAIMALAGAAWGFYTLSGRGVADPLRTTAGNFVRALPMAVLCFALFWAQSVFSLKGALLAAASGAIASGIGYAVWFSALKYHSATRSAILQLSVPAIAAVGGILVLDEIFAWRLLGASALILGGIALTIAGRNRK